MARGISGAAGYAYMGEDPAGAGLRYGLLGLRLDTGDMGGALRLAVLRDSAAVQSALGPDGQTLLDTVQAPTPAARLAPVAGKPLWEQPWKSILSRAAATNVFRAGQNEYCVEELLRPAAQRLLVHTALASGTALAMALDILAELGRDAGLGALERALSGQGAQSVQALRDALVIACPSCRLRLQDLARDKALAEWRPVESEVQQ
ncbi:MAG: hypothetical protein JSU82_17305 [Rhodospirillales bacterium]|nr:MAG: hypothetical protein JSU82_17305 [Rhodospirillales bacterium]